MDSLLKTGNILAALTVSKHTSFPKTKQPAASFLSGGKDLKASEQQCPERAEASGYGSLFQQALGALLQQSEGFRKPHLQGPHPVLFCQQQVDLLLL